ncbi:FitA-like ribbon-helix-helix domain-containing protein [Brevundimonas aurifodinae]|uniref:Antitoxin FitA-like ribbon-helix-helix domain-containing protein n=2 Tax=Brevundimonas TaxID=41275 RepID=A0ABV1NLD0_9CAUL|nr:MAG: hypothetical protein B7Z01_15050 [Brevundimonas subvibrioides]
MVIRNMGDATLAGVKHRAKRHGVSAEEEARRSLAVVERAEREAALARADAIRKMNGPQAGPTSLELLRRDRGRDEEA